MPPARDQEPNTVTSIRGRMTNAEYDAAREKLAPDKATAGIRWEQDLALLFYRSGWTQEELAKKEGKTQQWVALRIRFGRFLSFVGNTTMVVNLAERRFRGYWDRTAEHGGTNERIRFRAVLELMRSETMLSRPHVNTGHPKKIVAQFGDSKWHSLPVISKHLDAPEDEVERSLAGMLKHGWGDATTETKNVGTVKHFRFFKQDQMISFAEIIDKLGPIIKNLQVEGRKNLATMSPHTVAVLTQKLVKQLEEWAGGRITLGTAAHRPTSQVPQQEASNGRSLDDNRSDGKPDISVG